MKRIPVGNGLYTLVDDDDYERFKHMTVCVGARGYAMVWCRQKKRPVMFHRLINGTPDGLETDHINHDKLDNRRANLRTVNRKANSRNNSLYPRSSSGVKGVSWHGPRNKWRAHAVVDNRQIHLGYYSRLEDAAAARAAFEEKVNWHEDIPA